MREKHRPFRRAKQPTLFQATCQYCPLFSSCGGGHSAPCKCMYPVGDSRHHQCSSCSYICRERYVELENKQFDTFHRRLNSLTPLSELRITQTKLTLPPFIPSKTYELASGTQMMAPWAAVDLKKLPITTQFPVTSPHSCWYSAERLRECLRVSPDTELIAILNGSDPRLEHFWGINRFAFYETLQKCKIATITGPTFSVHEFDRASGFRIPETEKVINMMRHHRVLEESNRYFELSIPNLYWRNEDDIANWSAWLREHEHIHHVSRDLTCRGQRHLFIHDLLFMLEQVQRPLNIILLGIGSALAEKTTDQFSKIGCTVSIVSSDPIMKAVKARKKLRHNHELPPTSHDYRGVNHTKVALHNIEVMKKYMSN